jgi:hypothetical protein
MEQNVNGDDFGVSLVGDGVKLYIAVALERAQDHQHHEIECNSTRKA